MALCAISTATAQQKVLSLKECLEVGLQQNYDIRIVRNDERISSNNATAANAGMLPSLELSSGYSGSADRTEVTPRVGDKMVDEASYDQTLDVGVSLNWTLFDGMRVQTNLKSCESWSRWVSCKLDLRLRIL